MPTAAKTVAQNRFCRVRRGARESFIVPGPPSLKRILAILALVGAWCALLSAAGCRGGWRTTPNAVPTAGPGWQAPQPWPRGERTPQPSLPPGFVPPQPLPGQQWIDGTLSDSLGRERTPATGNGGPGDAFRGGESDPLPGDASGANDANAGEVDRTSPAAAVPRGVEPAAASPAVVVSDRESTMGGAIEAIAERTPLWDQWWFRIALYAGLAAAGLGTVPPAVKAGITGLRVVRRVWRFFRRPKAGSPSGPAGGGVGTGSPSATVSAATQPEASPAGGNFHGAATSAATGAPDLATFAGWVAAARRDGTEALELLQLLQLEGENPIHYAYIGLAAFDELARLQSAEASDAEREFAAALERRLKDRVNETLRVVETFATPAA